MYQGNDEYLIDDFVHEYWEKPECTCKRCCFDFDECQAALQDLITSLYSEDLQVEKARAMLEYLSEQFDVDFPKNQELEICKPKKSVCFFQEIKRYAKANAKWNSKKAQL